MKRIINFSVLSLFCFFAFTSCDDDEKLTESGPSIVKSDVAFDASGGSGSILVSANGAITASADKDWCSVSVSGSTVSVAVPANSDLTGRTALVSIKTDGHTLAVPVSQQGFVLALDATELRYSFAGGSMELTVTRSDAPFTVHIPEDVDWASYAVDGNIIEFITTATPTPLPRATKASIMAGNVVKEVVLSQNPVYADLLGEWTFQHSAGSFDVRLAQRVANSSYTLSDFIINSTLTGSIEVRYNAANGRLVISNVQYFGLFSPYHVYLLVRSAASVSFSDVHQYEGTLDITQPTYTYRFADNGTWTGQTVIGICTAAFNSQPPSGNPNYQGNYANYMNVVLIKK